MTTITGTGKYESLLERCMALDPVPTAVAHPCEASALAGAVEAGAKRLIAPILVGPAAKIREIALKAGIDLGDARIVDVPHSQASAAKAVELVRQGEAELLMKGSLHTDELLSAVVARDTGLRTGRRVSHVFIMDVPTYHKVLIVTDAAINIAPVLEDKVDICQNAIDLALSLGVSRPKVAILAAVETVTSKMPATIDAAALCKMADRGQITGGLLDGRWPSTMRSARRPQERRASAPKLPAIPTSSWFPISSPGTCSPSSSRSWPTPTAPGWCWARGCQSF